MTPEEKEVFDRIVSDFSKLKKKKKLGKIQEGKLVQDIVKLLGIYGFYKSRVLEKQIKNMIDFGDKQNWAMQGQQVEFDKLKKGKLKIKRLKGFTKKTKKK